MSSTLANATRLLLATAILALFATPGVQAASERVLEKNERHVVIARYEGDKTTFVLEAVGDTSDNLRGQFPALDFASIRVDVNQNGIIDAERTDVGYGRRNGTYTSICTQYLLTEGSSTGCGGFSSGASLAVGFKATAISAKPHPVWEYTIPNRELARGGSTAHMVFRFHESGRGYTRYPASSRANVIFSKVQAVDLRTLVASVSPEEAEPRPTRPEIPSPSEDEVVVRTNDVRPPEIELSRPGSSGDRITVPSKRVVVAGAVRDESGIYEVLINGEDANVSARGEFWREVNLAFGENQIRVRVSDTRTGQKRV